MIGVQTGEERDLLADGLAPVDATAMPAPRLYHGRDLLPGGAGEADALPPAEPVQETERDRLVRVAAARALEVHDQGLLLAGRLGPTNGQARRGPADLITAFEDEPHEPDDVFRRLRWGGQFLYSSRRRSDLTDLAARLPQRGYTLTRKPAAVRVDRFRWRLPWRLPLFSRKVHYLLARKLDILLPREFSDRFTYHVHLVPHARSPLGYVVQKEVPSFERVVARLRHKFPDAPQDVVEKRARKFTEKIFPVFLTREAAMLKILERDLPGPYRRRVPHVVELEQDERGFVRKLRMNWLRAGGRTLSQLEFARQAAELLDVLHDRAGVIHLDLRLDNFVITEHGVGFVDFGSAVRVGENLRANPMLQTIFDELMRTSQIQRMLEQMTCSGDVTSRVLTGAQGQVDKAVDLFYLAVQINNPTQNPEFEGLVEFNPAGDEAPLLAALTEDVLKPQDPQNPVIKTAGDLLRGIQRIEHALGRG